MLGPKNYLARNYEVGADRDHGRRREHPHPQPDHLRPGRDPLPSVRARRDGRREGPRSRARARRVRSAALQAHRLRALERGALVRAWRSRSRASPTCPSDGADAPLLPAHQPLQRVVRADHRRRDAHARRRAQAPRADLGAARRRAELPVPRVDGAQALSRTKARRPTTCRSSNGPAASLLYRTQEQFHGLLRNFPNRWVAALLRFAIFPRGRTYSAPSDELGQADRRAHDQPYRRRASGSRPAPTRPRARQSARVCCRRRSSSPSRSSRSSGACSTRGGRARSRPTIPRGRSTRPSAKGIVTAEEAASIRAFDRKVLELTGVDDFDPRDLGRRAPERQLAEPSADQRGVC